MIYFHPDSDGCQPDRVIVRPSTREGSNSRENEYSCQNMENVSGVSVDQHEIPLRHHPYWNWLHFYLWTCMSKAGICDMD